MRWTVAVTFGSGGAVGVTLILPIAMVAASFPKEHSYIDRLVTRAYFVTDIS